MPFNGSGTFAPYTPGNPVVTGTTISSSVHNATVTDLAAGLTNAVTRDGQSPATANIPMGNNKLTGLAAGTANGDAMRFEQTATSGANSNITSLSGLTTPLSVAQGGTGSAGAPSFSAYLASSGGSVSDSTFTKCLFDTEVWDTDGNFASSRFTPTVAGYYQINAAVQLSAAAPGFLTIYKYTSATTTLAEYKRGAWASNAGGAQDFAVSGLIKLAVDDYVEIYIRHTQGGSLTPQGGATVTWFDGHFVRGA